MKKLLVQQTTKVQPLEQSFDILKMEVVKKLGLLMEVQDLISEVQHLKMEFQQIEDAKMRLAIKFQDLRS